MLGKGPWDTAEMQDGGGERMLVRMDREPELPEVGSDDRALVRNIIYTVMALNKTDPFCKGWQVQCVPRGYIVVFFLNQGGAVSVHDMNMIRELNAARVTNVLVSLQVSAVEPRDPKPVLRVQVLDCKQPVVLYDADVVRVRKRGRVW